MSTGRSNSDGKTLSSTLAITPRLERNGAVAAECAALTGAWPDHDGIALGANVEVIERAAYVHHGVRVIDTAASFDQLVSSVRRSGQWGLPADRFRVDVHDPGKRIPMSSTEVAIAMADALPFHPDLTAPLHRFVVVAVAEQFYFGEIVTSSNAGYRRHDDKPWTTSSSLDSRFARALVNLVPDARSILDPCCGAGSIVIEAASLGLEAHGVDWKTPLVGMTRQNLAHFGYAATVTRADSRTAYQTTGSQQIDAIVTDLPYGNAITSDEQITREIIAQSALLAPKAVVVAPADISTWLIDAGYVDIDVHAAVKRRGFTRWIHVASTI